MIRVEMQTTSNCFFFLLIVNKLSHVSTCTTVAVTFSETVVRVRANLYVVYKLWSVIETDNQTANLAMTP